MSTNNTQAVTDARLQELWLACKSIDNRAFCVEFGRAVIAEMRIAQSPELSCWFGPCTTVEACAEDGCKTIAQSRAQDAAPAGAGGTDPEPEVRLHVRHSEWQTLSPEAQEALMEMGRRAVKNTREQERKDGIARANFPAVNLGGAGGEVGAIPDARAFCDAQSPPWAGSGEWARGWNACRDRFGRPSHEQAPQPQQEDGRDAQDAAPAVAVNRRPVENRCPKCVGLSCLCDGSCARAAIISTEKAPAGGGGV